MSAFLAGRTAVVTGASRGIGAAIARALAGAGASLVLAARRPEPLRALAEELGGARALAHPCDVTDSAAVGALARAAFERFGTVEILVNNAGTATSNPLHRETLDGWNEALAANATSVFLCARAFLPPMMERGDGRVVTVASVAAVTGARYIAAYAASKHAAAGLTRALAAEAAPRSVTVNALCPGYVDTPMTAASIARIAGKTGKTEAEAREALLAMNPQRRLIAPEEIARAVLWLCHDDARSVNGQCIVMDGGGFLG